MFSFLKNLEARRRQNEILREHRGKRTIILIAGHHRAGKMNRFPFWHPADPGAVCPYAETDEHTECEKIVTEAQKILARDFFHSIICPFDLDLDQKIDWVNDNFPSNSILFSIHLNGFRDQNVSGTETWYLSGSERGERIAREIQKSLVQKLKLRDRGIKSDLTSHHGSLGILRGTRTYDEWLVELGFLRAKSCFGISDLQVVRHHGAQAVADAAKLAFYE